MGLGCSMTVRIVTGDPAWKVHCPECDLDLEYDSEDRYPVAGGAAIMCVGCAKLLPEPLERPCTPNLGFSVHRYSDAHVCLEFMQGWVDVRLSSEGLSISVYNALGTMVTEAWATKGDFDEDIPDPPEFFVPAED